MARKKGGELEFLLNYFGDFQSYEINFGLPFSAKREEKTSQVG
jgi:hypothetical protein